MSKQKPSPDFPYRIIKPVKMPPIVPPQTPGPVEPVKPKPNPNTK